MQHQHGFENSKVASARPGTDSGALCSGYCLGVLAFISEAGGPRICVEACGFLRCPVALAKCADSHLRSGSCTESPGEELGPWMQILGVNLSYTWVGVPWEEGVGHCAGLLEWKAWEPQCGSAGSGLRRHRAARLQPAHALWEGTSSLLSWCCLGMPGWMEGAAVGLGLQRGGLPLCTEIGGLGGKQEVRDGF